MYQFFNRNTMMTYVAMPILLVLLRLRLILYPMDGYIATTQGDVPNGTPLYNSIFGAVADGSLLSIILSLVVTLMSAYIVAGITNRFHFLERQSGLPGALFIVLTSGFVMAQGLHPIQIFMLFLLWSIYILFAGAEDYKPMTSVFGASLIMSTGCLFWAKGILFWPLMIIMMLSLRRSDLKCFIAMLMGCAVPMLLYGTYQFVEDALRGHIEMWYNNAISPVLKYSAGKYSWGYIAITGIISLKAFVGAIGQMQKLSIIESRMFRIVIWFTIISALSIILSQYSFEMLFVVSGGVAILASSMLQRMKSPILQEILMIVLTASAVFIQWKIRGMEL